LSIEDVLKQLQRLEWMIWEGVKPGIVTAESLKQASEALQKVSEEMMRAAERLVEDASLARVRRILVGTRLVPRFVSADINALRWGGVTLTGRDVSGDLAKLQNLDVALSTRMPSSGGTVGLEAGTNLIGKVNTPDLTDAVTASDSVTAAENTAGLAVPINNGSKTLVQFRVTLGAAGEIRLEASPDGVNYYLLWKKTLEAAGDYCDWDFVAFPYFRVNVPTTGIDIEVEIRAVKA